MRTREEIENALEYYELKLPSIQRNESDQTIAVIETLVNTLRWALDQADKL